MKRVLVIGCSGAGKSTLANQLSQHEGLPYFPTDPFYWEAAWKPTPIETVVGRVERTIENPEWVFDGNFADQRDLVWRCADTVTWLDLSSGLVLARVVHRNLRLWLTREPTWSGNRMTWRRAWSGVRYVFRSHPKKRRRFPRYLSEFPHLEVLRFRTPLELKQWLRAREEWATRRTAR